MNSGNALLQPKFMTDNMYFSRKSRKCQQIAIVKVMVDKLNGSEMLSYYEELWGENGIREIKEQEQRILTSQNSLCKYYVELGLVDKCNIYSSMLSDYHRTIISRWRLSNHKLNIETGRYTKPKTKREDRVCTLWNVLEDEYHVIYDCPRYDQPRHTYRYLTENTEIKEFLNPRFEVIEQTANYIHAIEAIHNELKSWMGM